MDRTATHLFCILARSTPKRAAFLRHAMQYEEWQHLAQEEIRWRMHGVLRLCDDDTVAAIATGTLDVRQVAETVLDAHEKEENR